MTITRAIDLDALADDTIQKIHLSEQLLIPVERIVGIVNQLKEFELGRGMIINGGLTSSWVDYICHHKISPDDHPLEAWFLSRSPVIRAARERYFITQRILQANLRSHMNLCVLPCGVITKVAELDYSNVEKVKIIGYDADIQGLVKAEKAMQHLVDQEKINLLLLKKNIWLLDDVEQYDLIVSTRLSVLESNTDKVLELFRKYYIALKPKGMYVGSFFTPSPIHNGKDSPWLDVDVNDMLQEHSMFTNILGFHLAVRSESETRAMLHKVGFKIVEIYYDKHHVYPTIVAQKV